MVGERRSDTIDAPTSRARLLAAAPVLVALAVSVLLLAVSGRYGYQRDEFYHLMSGRHPALGYLDNPPADPLAGAGAGRPVR